MLCIRNCILVAVSSLQVVGMYNEEFRYLRSGAAPVISAAPGNSQKKEHEEERLRERIMRVSSVSEVTVEQGTDISSSTSYLLLFHMK